jgi:glycosyltransferase involved in cell wall biosynthesis
MIEDLTIAIPTLNSGRYLDIILQFYRDNDFPLTVFVDDRSDDNTFAVARRFGATVVSISNPNYFVGLVERMSNQSRTKWMLRIDDDELPTLAMMEFVRKTIAEARAVAYAFQRYQCAVSTSGRLLNSVEISPVEHRQWRLYQPAKMNYISRGHTPGFECDGSQKESYAPSETSMIHLDWAVHSYEQRKRKVERYDAQVPNEGTGWRSYYLYEERAMTGEDFVELPLPEFRKPCAEISRRFPDLCLRV